MTRSADIPHETGLLLALRRVRGGHVTVYGPAGDAVFADGRQPFPRVLVPFLHELFAHGQVRLDDQHGNEPLRVVLTTAGADLLTELGDGPCDEPER